MIFDMEVFLPLNDSGIINIITQEMTNEIRSEFPDSFEKQTKAYWERINGPWVDNAISSGVDIRFIQDPRLKRMRRCIYKTVVVFWFNGASSLI
ncbi:hypothetical protein CBF23_002275 [Marinomonas agarivorans]|nr:hypothetical protein CBF23_002275 [Marinomonas agarivorans]